MKKLIIIVLVTAFIGCDTFKSKEELLMKGKWYMYLFYDNENSYNYINNKNESYVFDFSIEKKPVFGKYVGKRYSLKNAKDTSNFFWKINADTIIVEDISKKEQTIKFQINHISSEYLKLKAYFQKYNLIETYHLVNEQVNNWPDSLK
jgi:hypothetical protein